MPNSHDYLAGQYQLDAKRYLAAHILADLSRKLVTEGKAVTLHTIRDKEHHEIDFVLAEESAITDLIEVKQAATEVSPYFHRMAEHLPKARSVQIVAELRQETQRGKVEVASAEEWLAGLQA